MEKLDYDRVLGVFRTEDGDFVAIVCKGRRSDDDMIQLAEELLSISRQRRPRGRTTER